MAGGDYVDGTHGQPLNGKLTLPNPPRGTKTPQNPKIKSLKVLTLHLHVSTHHRPPLLPGVQPSLIPHLLVIRLIEHYMRPLRLIARPGNPRLVVDQDTPLHHRLIPRDDDTRHELFAQVTPHPRVLLRHARLPLERKRRRA